MPSPGSRRPPGSAHWLEWLRIPAARRVIRRQGVPSLMTTHTATEAGLSPSPGSAARSKAARCPTICSRSADGSTTAMLISLPALPSAAATCHHHALRVTAMHPPAHLPGDGIRSRDCRIRAAWLGSGGQSRPGVCQVRSEIADVDEPGLQSFIEEVEPGIDVPCGAGADPDVSFHEHPPRP